MAEQNNVGGTDGSGAGGEAVNQTISYDTHKKLLDQRKADQAKMQEMNARLAELESEKKAQEEKALIESQNWQKLAEQRQQELDSVKQGKESLEKTIINAEKLDYFERIAGMTLAHPSFKNHINLDAITYDSEGNVDESTVKAELDRFTKEFGNSLFKVSKINTPPADAAKPPAVKSIGEMSMTELAEAKKAALAAIRGKN